jgi:hypothetical protein
MGKKLQLKNNDYFFIKNWNLPGYCTYPLASIKDVQATGEAFSPQKRTSSTSKHEISQLCFYYCGHFCTPGSRSETLTKTNWIFMLLFLARYRTVLFKNSDSSTVQVSAVIQLTIKEEMVENIITSYLWD